MKNEMKTLYWTKGLQAVYVKSTMNAFQSADKQDWKSALFASRIVGKYDRGATLGLADDCGKSIDTIEDRAHAYMLFEKLCELDDGVARRFVFNARRAPFIYLSHFRALYDIQGIYKLSDHQILNLLIDIVQSEGQLSSRKLEDHARGRYGIERTWDYYGERAMKEISKTLQSPDLPKEGREKLIEVYNWLGENA